MARQRMGRTTRPAPARGLPLFEGLDCVAVLRALAEDTRLQMIGLLFDAPVGVGELSRQLGISPYNTSKHLRILREAGLVEVEKLGRERRYRVPARITRHTGAREILDLGCCRFEFDHARPLTLHRAS